MIQIFHTQSPIFWNTGNELKPNIATFNKLVFKPATNFNVSWISETQIRVIVPSTRITTMIKISGFENGDRDKYYYLTEVVNRTSVNMECVYELDIWCTYLILLPDLRTCRQLSLTNLSKNINILPIGVPTGNIIYDKWNFDNDIKPDTLLRNFNDHKPYGTMQAYPGITTNIYFVFKSKSTENFDELTPIYKYENKLPELPSYVLVPLLNLCDYGLVKEYKVYFYEANQQKPHPDAPQDHFAETIGAQILNNAKNIDYLVQHYTEFSHHGLGEFIGTWIGPNYFRLQSKGIEVGMYNFGKAWNRGIGGLELPKTITQDIPIDFNSFKWVKYNNYGGQGTFLAIRTSANPLDLLPMDTDYKPIDKEWFLKGLKFQENSDNHLIISANKVFFNQTFNYSNGVETTAINLNIPYAYDSYYDTLNAQKSTLNTSLGLSGANSLIQGLTSSLGFIPPTPSITTTEATRQRAFNPQVAATSRRRVQAKGKRGGKTNMGWDTFHTIQEFAPQTLTNTSKSIFQGAFGNMASAGLGVARAGAQFLSTLLEQKAYREDLRRQLSSTVLNMNDKYVSWYTIANKIDSIGDIIGYPIEDIIKKLSYEILSGAETEPGIDYKFYGVESQPILVDNLEPNLEAYIQIDNNTALHYQNEWGAFYTPIIKEAMLTLLTNGVRVSSSKIK